MKPTHELPLSRRGFVLGSISLAAAAIPAAATAVGEAPRNRGSGAAPRTSSADARFDELSELIRAKMTEYQVPGVAFGVHKDGQLLARGFGVTSVEDPQAVTPDTLFPIASITKTVAATAIMRLVEAGRVELDAPVRRYVPDFRVQDDAATNGVTVAHLLTHTPGWEGQLPADDRGSETIARFVAGMRDLPQLSAPGTVWSYNNAGFALAGRVIEVVTGKGIHDALRELVFAPLGMTRAFTRPVDIVTHRFTVGHHRRNDRTEVARPFSFSTTTAGFVTTSLSNLLSYATVHLGDGSGPQGRFLSAESVQRMRTSRLRKNATEDEMGVGWHLRALGGVLTAAHGGTTNNHCLLLQIVPERRLAFSILTNHADGWRLVQDVERATVKAYEGVALRPGQRIGHRGVNEAMNGHATPLTTQPALEEFVGVYRRTPLATRQIRIQDGRLVFGGEGVGDTPLTFFGPDVAYATGGPTYVGSPFEFVRDGAARVGWMRINGRVAKKDG